MTAEALPSTDSGETANDRLKRSFDSWFSSFMGSSQGWIGTAMSL